MPPYEKKDGFTLASASTLRNSLAQKLIKPVDKVRDLATKLGARPYRVRVVRTRWSGGRRGVGVETTVHELELLPTPLVVDLGSIDEQVSAVGVTEIGITRISQISGRYTEDHLVGVDAEGNPPGEADSVYYEILTFRPDGQPGEHRRFALQGVPQYNATNFEWVVTLDAQVAKRGRDGRP